MAIGIAVGPRGRIPGADLSAPGQALHRRLRALIPAGLLARWVPAAHPAWLHRDAVAWLLLAFLLIVSYPLSAGAMADLIALLGPVGEGGTRDFGRGWDLVLIIASPHLAGAFLGLLAVRAGLPRAWRVLAAVAVVANLSLAWLLVDVWATFGG